MTKRVKFNSGQLPQVEQHTFGIGPPFAETFIRGHSFLNRVLAAFKGFGNWWGGAMVQDGKVHLEINGL